jgi:hypothetical protein
MIAALIIATLLAPISTVELHYIPSGTPLFLPTGERVQYFVFDEYKLLLTLDNDLWESNQKLQLLQELALKYTDVVAEKDKIIATLSSDKVDLSDKLKRAEDNWHRAELEKIDAASGPVWPYILAAGGVVVGVVGATLAVVFAISPKG